MPTTTVTAAYRRAGCPDPIVPPKAFPEFIAAKAWLQKAMRADPAAELGAVTEHLKRTRRVTVFAPAALLEEKAEKQPRGGCSKR